VAATKTKSQIVILSVAALLCLSYQNCAVDLSASTPGAASVSCVPPAQALLDFEAVESSILLPTGLIGGTSKAACGSCHGESAVSAGRSVYLVLGTAGVPNTNTSIKNYCAAQQKGAARLSHCGDASHSGGQYFHSDIPSFFNVISQYF
jgi:hypothetical protein